MITNSSTLADFLPTVSEALAQLKCELQHDYERAYPSLREIIHLVLDEEEEKAWELSAFPHLVFPDLVEAHIARLNLRPTDTRHQTVRGLRDIAEFPIYQPALA
jgi:hypothetical protein